MACSLCPHLDKRCIISYLAVIVAVFGCCLWSTIGFSGRCYGAILGSTEDTCSASMDLCTNSSYPAVLSPFSRRTEKCAQLMLQFTVFLALLTHGNQDIISATIVADSGCDDFWAFLLYFEAFFGLLFGVEPPGQCTGTGPCFTSLSDLHRRGAFVEKNDETRKKNEKIGFGRKILEDFHVFVSEFVSFPRKINNPFWEVTVFSEEK